MMTATPETSTASGSVQFATTDAAPGAARIVKSSGQLRMKGGVVSTIGQKEAKQKGDMYTPFTVLKAMIVKQMLSTRKRNFMSK